MASKSDANVNALLGRISDESVSVVTSAKMHIRVLEAVSLARYMHFISQHLLK